jgi:4-hydroxybenzoate polyprenyltransferase
MTLLLAYVRERLATGPVLLAVSLVVVAVLAGGGWPGGFAFVTDLALALALVMTFRIWDDLMDRERDRMKHPDRVVVRASSIAPLRFASWILGTAALIVLARSRTTASAGLLVGYMAVLAAVYATRGPRSAASDRILLLKYGVFTLGLIDMPDALTARGLLAAAAAFVVACAYEWWHDAESPVFSFGGSR